MPMDCKRINATLFLLAEVLLFFFLILLLFIPLGCLS